MIKQLALAVPAIRRLHENRNRLQDAFNAESARTSRLQSRVDELEQELLTLREGVASPGKRPFLAYFSTFDAMQVMRRHEVRELQGTAGLQTNWLGVLVDPKVYPPLLADQAGRVEPFPDPTNWHADIAEWAAALHAVDNAPRDSFTMIELGCGWGCWMNNMGAAARRTGRKLHLVGIDADEGHLQFAREALARNGFRRDEYTLLPGVAAPARGTALFPRQRAGSNWGLEPVLMATEQQRAEAAATGSHDIVPMVPLSEAIGDRPRIDLLHMDIQGGEADFVQQCLATMQEKVAYVVIGTHGKEIEARLFAMFLGAGWRLEMERPAFHQLEAGKPRLWADGVQGWRNPALMRAD